VNHFFTDEEGEWLEVRYDKSMSKQVQRYSSDIRPHPDDLKKSKRSKEKKERTSPFTDNEMKSQQFQEKERAVRQAWDKGDEVEIFSNTHQEWYLGEVVDIIKDDEGEWLNCVWARANGEAMSKQVQRFSTDVRPVQDDNSSSDASEEDKNDLIASRKLKELSPAEKTQALATKIASRKTNFRRRAPPFSRTLRPSTFTYPATSSARRSRKLLDLEETLEKNQHVVDSMPTTKKQRIKRVEIEHFKPLQVREFIRSLGSAFERYASKFRNVKGSQLLKFTEISLQKFGISAKLHRNKILLEIARNSPQNIHSDLFKHNVDVLNWNTQKVQEWCSKTSVISIYSHKFLNHGIDGMLLFELDAKDLSTIGVKKIHQQRILDIISKFAQQQFPANNDDDDKKEEELSNGENIEIKERKKRGSVAHIDVAELNKIQNGNIEMTQNQNNDAIIYTMGQLLLELGQMFKVGKVQDLTNRLKEQLNELQQNSNHPQMMKRGSLDTLKVNIKDTKNMQTNNNNKNEKEKQLIQKMADRVDTSPTGVDSAWIKTQNQAKGHKRRSSLPFINTNQLEQDEDDEEDISDIE